MDKKKAFFKRKQAKYPKPNVVSARMSISVSPKADIPTPAAPMPTTLAKRTRKERIEHKRKECAKAIKSGKYNALKHTPLESKL